MSPGALDAALVRRHLAALDAALTNLRRHGKLTVDQLRSDLDRLWAVERGLQLCAQNAIDVATHIAAASGRTVSDYAGAIDELAPLGVLPSDFVATFRRVAAFRNILVHGYLEVDVEKLHAVLHDHLAEFSDFAAHVERFLAA
jgi:uncharacterized protein YutE (UPF0331/DUF86 family)